MDAKKPAGCESRPFFLSDILCGSEEKGLNRCKTSHLYKRKQILYSQGNEFSGLYCLQSGRVKLYRTSAGGKQYIFRLAEPGEVLGLPNLFTAHPHLWTAEVIEEGVICFIPRQEVLDFVRENPQVAERILCILSNHLLESEKERVELVQGNVRERMARLLAFLAESHGLKVKNGKRIDLKLSREEMAEMIGTAAETAIRLLRDFKDEALIEVHGKEIVILDEAGLAGAAHMSDLIPHA